MSALSPLVAPRTDSVSVLHVDDDADFAELTATFLERDDERFEVTTATSASEGLELLGDGTFDCVVSDYDMPGLSGIEFLESVRESHPELPFVLFTGKGSEEVASDAISAGVTDYLQKEPGTDQYAVLGNRISNAIDHYRSRQVVEQSEQRLRDIIDAVPHLVYVVDEAGTYRLANEALARFHGTSVDDIEGEHVRDVLGEEDAASFQRDLAAVIRSGSPKRLPELVMTDEAGTEHVLEPRLLPYDLGERDERAVLGIAVDVTDRQQRECELERTRERMQLALEHTDSVVFELDVESGDLVRHGADNRFFDLDPGAVPTVEAHAERAVHPADRETFLSFYEAVIDGSSDGGTLEYRTRPRSGDLRWIRDTVSVQSDGADGSRHVVGIARDVTEHKEQELELRRKERRYQAVFNDPNILVGLLDTDGTVLDINQTAMAYVDTTRDAIAGESLWEAPWFDHSAVLQEDVRGWIDRAASGEYVEFQADLQRPSGELYTVEGVFRPVTDENGEVVSLLVSDRDVTERTARERQLQRYEAYLEESSDVITVLDAEGTITYQSPAVERVLGYEPEEFVGNDGFEYVHPDDLEAVLETFEDLVGNPGGSVTVECRFRTADGGWRWLEVHGTNRLGHEAIGGIVTNNRDITERKQRERELEQTNTVLSTLFETLPVGVLAEDADRNVLAVNERLVELLDFPGSPEETVGEDCEAMAERISDRFDEPDGFIDRIDDLVRAREPASGEELALDDGRTLERDYRPIELPDGRGHLWVYADVTEEKRQRRRYEAIFNHTFQFTGLLEPDGTLIEANDAALSFGGFDREDVVGEKLWETPWFQHSPETNDRAREAVARAADGEFVRHDVPVQGTEREAIIDFSVRPVTDDNGTVILLVPEGRDITELKERERALERERDRLEEFAGVVSHDLRNPLNVVEGRLALAREECDSDHLAAIERALERMDRITEDVLWLAREGRDVGAMDAVVFGDCLEDAWTIAADGAAGASLRFVDEDGSRPVIEADVDRLSQLLENLFGNAIEHGGPAVSVTVGTTPDGFYVADDGPGIPDDRREDVFAAGYSTREDGNGFGLRIVEQVAEAHGWEISLTESDAGGARFELTGVEFVED